MSRPVAAAWTLPPFDILVVSDLSLAAANAAWRGAQLARAHGATLRLLHVARDPRAAQAARASLQQLAAAFRDRLEVAVDVAVPQGELARETASAALGASLLVVPAQGVVSWRDRIGGTGTQRLVRASRIPVLVVKRPLPRTRDSALPAPPRPDLYQRVLACVDLASDASGVIAAAASLSADPRLEVFHALRPDQQAPADKAQGAAGTAVERARTTLRERIAQAGAAAQGAIAAVGLGDPGASAVAKARAIGAELLVLGKRESRLLGDLAVGPVTREVLSGAPCDVLLVPARPAAAGSVQSAAVTPGAPSRADAAVGGSQ